MWDLISHLWFYLLVLVILTAFGMLSFRWLRDQQRRIDYQQVGWEADAGPAGLCWCGAPSAG